MEGGDGVVQSGGENFLCVEEKSEEEEKEEGGKEAEGRIVCELRGTWKKWKRV